MCPKCNGSGIIDDHPFIRSMTFYVQRPVCRGHGHGERKGCDQCDPPDSRTDEEKK